MEVEIEIMSERIKVKDMLTKLEKHVTHVLFQVIKS
jgi:hypothetical protein